MGGGEPVDLVGRHCESGDVLSAGVALREPRVGDVVAVPATGAYCFTMRNNYNGARRPPVVFVRDGDARVVVRREGYDDLLRLDVVGRPRGVVRRCAANCVIEGRKPAVVEARAAPWARAPSGGTRASFATPLRAPPGGGLH